MSTIAPEIYRQRLLLEGYYTVDMTEDFVRDFLLDLASHLGLRTYGEPIVHSPSGEGSELNQGYDAFVPLIDSGISLYIWSKAKFFSLIVYSCKPFDCRAAVDYVTRQLAPRGDLVVSEF